MRVIASGIDTLHLSVRGELRSDALDHLQEAKARAQLEAQDVPIEFPVTGQAFTVRPYGLRGYAYWLSSPDFELIVGLNERFPAALVQLHAAYLHSCGHRLGIDLAERLLRLDVFAAQPHVTPSRVDLYADTQGWPLTIDDQRRFVSPASFRRAFEVETFSTARTLTGFMFGKGSVVARLYDKTREIRRRGVAWLEEIWSGADPSVPVWRIEFQFRRTALAEFHLEDTHQLGVSIQDLWRYATQSWLSYRTPTDDPRVRRWPVDPVWEEVQAVRLSPVLSGVVRRKIEGASKERAIRGLMGYGKLLGALLGLTDGAGVFAAAWPEVKSYLAARDRSFAPEVVQRAARLMAVSAPWDDLAGGGAGAAGAGRGCDRELRPGELAADIDGTLLCSRCAGLARGALRFEVRDRSGRCGASLRDVIAGWFESQLAGRADVNAQA